MIAVAHLQSVLFIAVVALCAAGALLGLGLAVAHAVRQPWFRQFLRVAEKHVHRRRMEYLALSGVAFFAYLAFTGKAEASVCGVMILAFFKWIHARGGGPPDDGAAFDALSGAKPLPMPDFSKAPAA